MGLSLHDLLAGKRKPLVMAHRGNRVLFPENTLPAFRQAWQEGADIIETDLHLSRDGEFICIHDGTLDRTTCGEGLVAARTLKELKDLVIVDEKSGPTEYQIPALEELARELPEGTALALELKTDRFLEKEVCERLARLLDRHGALERVICLSFSYERVSMVKKTAPEIPIGWITMSRLLPDKDADMIGPFWPVMFINPWYARMAHRHGMLVCPLDPTPEPRLKQYVKMSCDAVLSDNPGKTRAALDELLAVNLAS